jgi:hypothetical protein
MAVSFGGCRPCAHEHGCWRAEAAAMEGASFLSLALVVLDEMRDVPLPCLTSIL